MSKIEKIVVHFFDGSKQESYMDELSAWVGEHIYEDYETKERRQILIDPDRNRLFFFADPFDFDKDDTHKPARYWLDEIEGWREEWFDEVIKRYVH